MSEASTQKLLMVMTCAFGAVLVLAICLRRQNQNHDHLPRKSDSVSQARPETQLPRRDHPASTSQALPLAKQSSNHWQSAPAIAQPSNAAARAFPAQASSPDHQSSIKNFFTPTTPPQSISPPRKIDRHPTAQKLKQFAQQNSRRQAPQTASRFHDFGNVAQAMATSPMQKRVSNVTPADFELQIPERDLFSVLEQPHRHRASHPTAIVPKTPSANQMRSNAITEQPGIVLSAPRQVPSASPIGIAAKPAALETPSARTDNSVRKANWTEIEPTRSIDSMTQFRPLEQPMLSPRRASPQIESQAHEKIEYGQSLARRRAYFAAREEFIRALLLIANSYNAETNSRAHPSRLAQGLIAIDELEDFMRPDNGQRLQQKILSHKSHLLTPQNIATTSPTQAVGLYSNFAQTQIEQAIGFSAAGSEALHALGKLESMVPGAESNQLKTLVFYQAAINVNPSNTVCINDLGVLLFDIGRLEESESVFLAALGSSQTELSWSNLALVHNQRAANANSDEQRSQQLALAKLATREAGKLAAGPRNAQPNNTRIDPGQWATPNEFQNNAAFPNVVVQHADSRSPQNTPQPGVSRSATLKQKIKDWF